MTEFEKYKLVFSFLYDGELLKGWINEENYSNLFLEDWNELMNVIKKIDDILYKYAVDYVMGEDNKLDEFYNLELQGLYYRQNEVVVCSNIETVYEDVVEFIKFYNSPF